MGKKAKYQRNNQQAKWLKTNYVNHFIKPLQPSTSNTLKMHYLSLLLLLTCAIPAQAATKEANENQGALTNPNTKQNKPKEYPFFPCNTTNNKGKKIRRRRTRRKISETIPNPYINCKKPGENSWAITLETLTYRTYKANKKQLTQSQKIPRYFHQLTEEQKGKLKESFFEQLFQSSDSASNQKAQGVTFRESPETYQNHLKLAFNTIYQWSQNPSKTLQKEDIHKLIKTIIHGAKKGKANLRKEDGGKPHANFALSKRLPKILEYLLDYINQEHKESHPFIVASLVQQIVSSAHFYTDGNGRLGSLLSAYVLMKAGYPPVSYDLYDKHNLTVYTSMPEASIPEFADIFFGKFQWIPLPTQSPNFMWQYGEQFPGNNGTIFANKESRDSFLKLQTELGKELVTTLAKKVEEQYESIEQSCNNQGYCH